MAKFNHEAAKAEIAQIVEIVKTVPENLQQRCFELLFEAAFADQSEAKPANDKNESQKNEGEQSKTEATAEAKKIPGNVLGFTRAETGLPTTTN